jgi:hypothetical protein
MDRRTLAAFATATFCIAACGDDTTGSGGGGTGGQGATTATTGATGATTTSTTATSTGAGGGDGGGAAEGGGGAGSGMTTLVSTDWSLPPGSERYDCTYLTLEEDVWVTEFHPVIPVGTHHTVVTLVPGGTEEDGTRECFDPFEGGPNQIYGTGVGTQPLIMPEGAAVKLPAGQQLVLNLHIFNAGAEDISGTSGIEIVTADESAIEHEVDLEIWGTTDLLVMPNDTTVESTACVIASDLSLIFAVPHMHTRGRHLKLTHTPQGGEPVDLLDAPYDFDEQRHEAYDPAVHLAAGDTIAIECTYENDSDDPITFGESTTDEMCFAGLWVYPAGQIFCQ